MIKLIIFDIETSEYSLEIEGSNNTSCKPIAYLFSVEVIFQSVYSCTHHTCGSVNHKQHIYVLNLSRFMNLSMMDR